MTKKLEINRFKKFLEVYNKKAIKGKIILSQIEFIKSQNEPSLNNAWLSGFFDSDGSIYLNLLSSQMFFSASQKNKYLLDILCELYGGTGYNEKTSFKWVFYKKSQ